MVPRPLRELVATAEARRRGVPAPEVLAARIDGGLVYRGVLVTAELRGAATLLEALRRASDAGARRALARRAGQAVGVLHRAGIFHADLNPTNLLVHPGRDGDEVAVVDFDRARVSAMPLGARARRRNLARLARSLAKHDLDGTLASAEIQRAFCAAYAEAPVGEPRFALEATCVS